MFYKIIRGFAVTPSLSLIPQLLNSRFLARGPPRAIQIQDSKDFAKSLLRFEIRVKI